MSPLMRPVSRKAGGFFFAFGWVPAKGANAKIRELSFFFYRGDYFKNGREGLRFGSLNHD